MDRPATVLLTNDDGIDAPGIIALEQAFSEYKNVDVWTVAPNRERSTSSHAMHLAQPIFVADKGSNRFSVDGFPADCVYLALYGLMDRQPDVIVSGINAGANLGNDVIYSGTVACAREAVVRGIHGVSVSLVDGDNYKMAAKNACKIALDVARLPQKPARLINLNYPRGSFEGPRLARLGIRKYPHVVSKRIIPISGKPYYWLGGPPVKNGLEPGTDTWLISRGIASCTPLLIDQTDCPQIKEINTLLTSIESSQETE
jgi:5'-nucleotidase